MGNKQTTYDVTALVDIIKQQANTDYKESVALNEKLSRYVNEQNLHHTSLDLLPDRVTDILCICLVLLTIALTVYVVTIQKKIGELENRTRNDDEFLKHRLIGVQLDKLTKRSAIPVPRTVDLE